MTEASSKQQSNQQLKEIRELLEDHLYQQDCQHDFYQARLDADGETLRACIRFWGFLVLFALGIIIGLLWGYLG